MNRLESLFEDSNNPLFGKKELIEKCQLLIVDDIPQNLQVLGNILKENGFMFAFAMDGKQALNTAFKLKPDLILLDVNMPEMDGFEAARNLKNNDATKDIPIIFLTARNDRDDLVEGFMAGGVDYITKPYDKSELLMRVINHLELKFAKEKIKNQNLELQKKQEELARESQKIILLNEQLSDSEAHLTEINAAKDRFFSIIAHDLKNPLSGLSMAVEVIINYYNQMSEDEIKAHMNALGKSAKTAFDLLENLLEWSRSQTGRLEFEPLVNSLNESIDKAIDLLNQSAKNKNIELIKKIPKDTTAYYDSNMIETVFRNLISNAIKFTNEYGSITISAEDDGTQLKIAVADTGIGIPHDHIGKLFRIDVNQTTLGTSDEKGTGLGLILCKEYLEKHNKEIFVESALNEGTTFYFYLDKERI